MLSIRNLRIRKPDGDVLVKADHLDLETGLVWVRGPNGAGKSTLFRSMFGLCRYEQGSISLDGVDAKHQRRQFLRNAVYMPQNFPVYADLTGLEFLVYFLRLRGVAKRQARAHARYWLERVGLQDAADARAGTYSHGMQQRLGFIYAMQMDVPLCVLDEPTAGVDAQARAAMHEILDEEARHRIVLMTSHELHDEPLRDLRVVELKDGSLRHGGMAC